MRRLPNLPRELEDALRAREPDAENRLRRPTGFTWLERFLAAGLPCREVPVEFWTREDKPEGTVAHIECRCGATAVASVGAYPVQCECPRWFFYDGTRVWALAGPQGAAASA